MGILTIIVMIIVAVFRAIFDIILLLITTLVYFGERVISFPLQSDENSFKSKYELLHNSSNRDTIRSFTICSILAISLTIVGDILFNIFLGFYELIGIFPSSLAQIKNDSTFIEESTIDGIGDTLVWLIRNFICNPLDAVIRLIFVIVFICIMAQLLYLVLCLLLYLLDLYILARRSIINLPDYSIGESLNIEQKDAVLLGFILGLLIMPAISTMIISIFIHFLGVLYQMIHEMWFLRSGSRIAIPLLEQVIKLINAFFSIDLALGRITRMLIGLFWMIIGLSIFRYQAPSTVDIFSRINSDSSISSISDQYDPAGTESFIKNYAISFLLLFSPVISLSMIYYLRFVVIPL